MSKHITVKEVKKIVNSLANGMDAANKHTSYEHI